MSVFLLNDDNEYIDSTWDLDVYEYLPGGKNLLPIIGGEPIVTTPGDIIALVNEEITLEPGTYCFTVRMDTTRSTKVDWQAIPGLFSRKLTGYVPQGQNVMSTTFVTIQSPVTIPFGTVLLTKSASTTDSADITFRNGQCEIGQNPTDYEPYGEKRESLMDIEITNADFHIRKSSVNDPFNNNNNNTATLNTSGILLENTMLHLKLRCRDTSEEVDLKKFIVVNASLSHEDDFDNSYQLVQFDDEDMASKIYCSDLNYLDERATYRKYARYVLPNGSTWDIDQYEIKMIVSAALDMATYVNFLYSINGLPTPIPKVQEEHSIPIQFKEVEFRKYTLKQLLNIYEQLLAVTQIDSIDNGNYLIYENVMPGSKASYSMKGIDYLGVKFDCVDTVVTEEPGDESSGYKSHYVRNYPVNNTSVYWLKDKSQYDKPNGNGYEIEFPFVIGEKEKSFSQNQSTMYTMNRYGASAFLTNFETKDLSFQSFSTVFSPRLFNMLGKWIGVYDYSNPTYKIDGGYQISDTNLAEFNDSRRIYMPFLALDLHYDGGISATLSTGDEWRSGNNVVSDVAGTNIVVSSSNSQDVSILMNKINSLQLKLNELSNRVVDTNNFANMLSNVDFLEGNSQIIQTMFANDIAILNGIHFISGDGSLDQKIKGSIDFESVYKKATLGDGLNIASQNMTQRTQKAIVDTEGIEYEDTSVGASNSFKANTSGLTSQYYNSNTTNGYNNNIKLDKDGFEANAKSSNGIYENYIDATPNGISFRRVHKGAGFNTTANVPYESGDFAIWSAETSAKMQSLYNKTYAQAYPS